MWRHSESVGGRVVEYRAISEIRRDAGRGGIRTIVNIAMRRTGESPVRPIARTGCCVSGIYADQGGDARLGVRSHHDGFVIFPGSAGSELVLRAAVNSSALSNSLRTARYRRARSSGHGP